MLLFKPSRFGIKAGLFWISYDLLKPPERPDSRSKGLTEAGMERSSPQHWGKTKFVAHMMEAGRSGFGIMQHCAQRKRPHRVIFHTLGSCDHPVLKPHHPLTARLVSVSLTTKILDLLGRQQLRSIMRDEREGALLLLMR